MQSKLVAAALVAVGVLHLMPILGVLGVARLQALYGVTIVDQNLEVLLRHRAIFFGMLGGLMLFSVYCRMYRTLALGLGLVSLVSFLVLCSMVDGLNEKLNRIFVIDSAALLILVIALGLQLSSGLRRDNDTS